MIQWSLAAFGPAGLAAAIIITVVGTGIGVGLVDTDIDPIWDDDDGGTPGSDGDGGITISHDFRYWDFSNSFHVSEGASFSEEFIESSFMQYYNLYGSSQYVSLEDHLNHIPEGLEGMSEEFLTSLWAMTWGTWDESKDDEYYGGGDVTIIPGEEEDDIRDGTTVILPGIGYPGIDDTVNPDETVNPDDTSPGFTYRTEPTVRYVSDYIYDYMTVYQYTRPDPDLDIDWFETDGDFSVSYYQEDYFDWGLYFLILFPLLAAEILIFNRFRHPKVVS